MSLRRFSISPIFQAANISISNKSFVLLGSRMEVPEKNPHDEWITLGLIALSKLKKQGFKPKVVADIGTGNGILAIGMAHLFHPGKIYLTDIVGEVLIPSKNNLIRNIASLKNYEPEIVLKEGRDAIPLPQKEIDLFVFSPPPLMVDDKKILEKGLARTTLTEREHYSSFAKNSKDILLKWSVLPWYVFLKNVKKKMNSKNVVLGIYSGRIPLEAIKEAYKRAGLKLKIAATIVKKQQDPRYLKMYADYEKRYLEGDKFYFYKYDLAKKLMKKKSLKMPGVNYKSEKQLRKILEPAKISAREAYELSRKNLPVAHLGYALVGTLH